MAHLTERFNLNADEQADEGLIRQLQWRLKEDSVCEGCTDAKFCKKTVNQHWQYVIHRSSFYGNAIHYDTLKHCRPFEEMIKRQRLSSALLSSKLPLLYHNLSWSDYQLDSGNKTAVIAAKQAVKAGTGLYISGPCGVGKTMLAAIIANEGIKAGENVIFATFNDLLSAVKSTFNSGEKTVTRRQLDSYATEEVTKSSAEELIHEICNVPLLILDDIGAGKNSDWAAEQLFKIINDRTVNNFQTIITSNWSLEKLEEHLSWDGKTYRNGERVLSENLRLNAERVIDRIRGICEVVSISGRSKRRFMGGVHRENFEYRGARF